MDVEEQLRAIVKVGVLRGKLVLLPENCTFTVVIKL